MGGTDGVWQTVGTPMVCRMLGGCGDTRGLGGTCGECNCVLGVSELGGSDRAM